MNQNESGVDPPHSRIGQGVTHSMDSPNRRSREGSGPFSPWEKAEDEGSGIRNATKCNQMQPN